MGERQRFSICVLVFCSLAMSGCIEPGQSIMHSIPVQSELSPKHNSASQDIEGFLETQTATETPEAKILEFANKDCSKNFSSLSEDQKNQCRQVIEKLCRDIDSKSDEIEPIPHWRPQDVPVSFMKDVAQRSGEKVRNDYMTCALYSYIAEANSSVIAERQKVKELHLLAQKGELDFSRNVDLKNLQKKYQLQDNDSWDEFYRKVDVIPASILLSMAHYESSVNSTPLISRFSLVANNIFGRHAHPSCQDGVTCVKALKSSARVIKYSSLEEAVDDQILYLNRLWNYPILREIRHKQRLGGQGLSGWEISAGLDTYSAKKGKYVKVIRNKMTLETRWIKYDESELFAYDFGAQGLDLLLAHK